MIQPVDNHPALVYNTLMKQITLLKTYFRNPFHQYTLQERLGSGRVITHLDNTTIGVIRNYINRVWLDSHPPVFIIRRA